MKVDYVMASTTGPVEAPAAVARAARIGYDGVFSVETAHDPYLQLAAGIPSGPGLDFGTAIAVAFPRSPMSTAMIAWENFRARFNRGFDVGAQGYVGAGAACALPERGAAAGTT